MKTFLLYVDAQRFLVFSILIRQYLYLQLNPKPSATSMSTAYFYHFQQQKQQQMKLQLHLLLLLLLTKNRRSRRHRTSSRHSNSKKIDKKALSTHFFTFYWHISIKCKIFIQPECNKFAQKWLKSHEIIKNFSFIEVAIESSSRSSNSSNAFTSFFG